MNQKEIKNMCKSFSSLPTEKKINVIFFLVSSELVARLDSTSQIKEVIEQERIRDNRR